MCGLAFVINTQGTAAGLGIDRKEMLAELILLNLWRGDDATGSYGAAWDGSHARLDKKGVSALDYIQMASFKHVVDGAHNYNLMLGHTRKSTNGAQGAIGAHPHQHGHITLIHNGHIANWGELPYPAGYKPVTDTDAVAAAFAHAGYKETLSKLRGAFALVWHDTREKKVGVVVNSERNLYFGQCEDKSLIVGASEYEAVEFVLGRRNKKYEVMYFESEVKKHGKEFGTVYWFEQNDKEIKMTSETVEFYSYKAPVYNLPSAPTPRPVPAATFDMIKEDLKPLGIKFGEACPIIVSEWIPYENNKEFGSLIFSWAPYGANHDLTKDKTVPMWGIAHGVRKNEFNKLTSGNKNRMLLGTPAGYHVAGSPTAEDLLRPEGGYVYITAALTSLRPHSTTLKDEYREEILDGTLYADDWLSIRHIMLVRKRFSGVDVVMEDEPDRCRNLLKYLALSSAIDQGEKLAYFTGPGGIHISFDRMRELVKDGCSFCKSELLISEWSKLTWIHNAPVCPNCEDKPEVVDTIHNSMSGFYPYGID